MNLHEYQAKNLLRKYGVAVPSSEVVWSAEEAVAAADKLDCNRWVVKAQVHAGGRGKAGGVRIVDTKEELKSAVKELLGTRLVTYQTDEHGQPVHQILVEEPSDIANELYLGMVIDRTSQRITFMASTEGGVEIEEVAEKTPEKILKATIDPVVGLQPFQCRDLFFGLGLDNSLLKSFTKMLLGLYQFFVERDLGMLEINPLIVTASGELMCLDCKVNVDDNALYR